MEARKVFTVDDLMAAIAGNAMKHEEPEYEGRWAMSSRFYDQVMEDGHIFNPYLHRRFVPSQFLRLMKYNNMDARAGIERCYGFVYSMEWLKEEVRKLVFLQKADPIAFEERKNFLTISDIKDIVCEYANIASVFITKEVANYYTVRVGKSGRIRRSNAEKFISELNQFNNDVQSVITYETMNELLQAHEVVRASYGTRKPDAFIEAFEKGGAYYTLKHLVMFERLSLNGKSGAEACSELANYLNAPADVIYAALKDTISANNYAF